MDDGAAGSGLGQPGEESTPLLALDGFGGTLERLLAMARVQQVDLARLSLRDLCDQLGAALLRASGTVPLGQQGDWVVMGAWLVQLRSRLLLPADEVAMQMADAEPDRPRAGLTGLEEMQALVAWLDGRPLLGRNVFVRGQPEWMVETVLGTDDQVDVIEFLWASLALFDDDLAPADPAPSYRPAWLDLHSVPDASKRIRRLLAGLPDGRALDQLLPAPALDAAPPSELRRRSAWTSTFVASLELAKQGGVLVGQDILFGPIHVSLPLASTSA